MRALPLPLRRYLTFVYLLGLAVIALSVAAWPRAVPLWTAHGATLAWQGVVFAALTLLGERVMMRLRGNLIQALTTSAHVASILVLPAPAPLAIALVAIATTQLTARGLPLYKRAFNLAHTTTTVGGTSLFVSLWVPPGRILLPGTGVALVPLLVLVVSAYYLLDIVPMVVVLSLAQGKDPRRVWRSSLRQTLLPELSASAMGILAAVVWLSQPLLLALFAIPLAGLRTAFQAINRADDRAAALRRKSEQLETVLAAGQDMRLHRSQADLLVPIAEAARQITGAATVTAYLPDPEDDDALQRIWVLPLDGVTGGPLQVRRTEIAPDVHDTTTDGERSVTLPLDVDEARAGAMLHLQQVPPELGTDDLDVLSVLAAQASIALQNARLHERALAQVSQDGLTGLLNHRAFQTRLEEEVARACRAGQQLSLLMVDLDDFGTVNNRFGHQAGDLTLAAVAMTLRQCVRPADIAARYGGDEFAVILPETTAEEALDVAERLRAALQAQGVSFKGIGIATGTSIGVAALPLHATTREALIAAADQAAYAAKRAGKGRICRPEDAVLELNQDPAALAAQLAHANMATVEALAAAVDAKDPYTRGHSQRVSAWAAVLARSLELPEAAVARVQLAGVLHDVGKIGIPDAILTKAGALTPQELTMMRGHPAMGERMLEAVPFLRDILPAVRHHHERWDGSGYPDGLSGAAIPGDAAILAVADAFDAMTSSRTYRAALPIGEARRRIHEGSGTQFAPHVVAAFERAVTDGSLMSHLLGDDVLREQRPLSA